MTTIRLRIWITFTAVWTVFFAAWAWNMQRFGLQLFSPPDLLSAVIDFASWAVPPAIVFLVLRGRRASRRA